MLAGEPPVHAPSQTFGSSGPSHAPSAHMGFDVRVRWGSTYVPVRSSIASIVQKYRLARYRSNWVSLCVSWDASYSRRTAALNAAGILSVVRTRFVPSRVRSSSDRDGFRSSAVAGADPRAQTRETNRNIRSDEMRDTSSPERHPTVVDERGFTPSNRWSCGRGRIRVRALPADGALRRGAGAPGLVFGVPRGTGRRGPDGVRATPLAAGRPRVARSGA
jgi:hypothetical protein